MGEITDVVYDREGTRSLCDDLSHASIDGTERAHVVWIHGIYESICDIYEESPTPGNLKSALFFQGLIKQSIASAVRQEEHTRRFYFRLNLIQY